MAKIISTTLIVLLCFSFILLARERFFSNSDMSSAILFLVALLGSLVAGGLVFVWLGRRESTSSVARVVLSTVTAVLAATALLTNTIYRSAPVPPAGQPSPLPPSPLQTPPVYAPAPVSFWPPPRPSGMVIIPSVLLASSLGPPTTLADLNQHLLKALDSAGYLSYSYFTVPSGFALVTQLEQIQEDGTPVPGDARFSEERPLVSWTLIALGRALFIAREGHFRIIVFIVSPIPFSPGENVPSGRKRRAGSAEA
jgi:hypothetical protein